MAPRMIAPPIPQTTPMIVLFELADRPDELELLLLPVLRLAVDVDEAEPEMALAVLVDLTVDA